MVLWQVNIFPLGFENTKHRSWTTISTFVNSQGFCFLIFERCEAPVQMGVYLPTYFLYVFSKSHSSDEATYSSPGRNPALVTIILIRIINLVFTIHHCHNKHHILCLFRVHRHPTITCSQESQVRILVLLVTLGKVIYFV